MRLRHTKVIAFLTIFAVVTGTVCQAADYKNTCQPGKCCCVSDNRAPRMAHPHDTNIISKRCNGQASCCHLNANPLVKNVLPLALTSNPTPLVHVMAVDPGTRTKVPDALISRQTASNNISVLSGARPLYLQFSTILC